MVQWYTVLGSGNNCRLLNKKKVERAQLLLCTTDMPVKEVAYRIGFNDQSYFIRMYRKVTGTTPQEYRKQQGLS